MKLKDVYGLIDGVKLVCLPGTNTIKYGTCLPEPPEDVLEMEVETITPFYEEDEDSLYEYGVYIDLK